ncbi:hypothetical protein CANINC_001136 [Pichia inconspicua]|uniref:3-oxoacyl-[acyl-carrier-protein] reductase n=1 Tax=Pichia inconspicua TaxID=52247 RepID=A0A4T0X499_9ASCO|nr:hypothetical protein CANINC_001136 [[Candida] inconspicua]
MTGPLSWIFYRTNWLFLEVSNLLVGLLFDPNRDIVLVTGGSSGLGKEISSLFHQRGAKVVVFDLVLPEMGSENYLEGVHYYVCDVSNPDDVKVKAKQVLEDVGIITILVNNAGIVSGEKILDLSFDQIEKTISVNLLSSFYTVKTFLPYMLDEKRGYIVTIGSTLGYMSPARLSAYGASKSGLIALHESLTYELGSPTFNTSGVKTLLICPGQLKTRMFDGVKTPSTLFAPELDPKDVAKQVLKAVTYGCRGEIKMPFYGNFMPIFRSVPWPIVAGLRYISGIDTSMKKFVDRTKEASIQSAAFIADTTSMVSQIFASKENYKEDINLTVEQ